MRKTIMNSWTFPFMVIADSMIALARTAVIQIHYGFLFLFEITAADLVHDREQTCVGICSQPTFLLGLVTGGTLVSNALR